MKSRILGENLFLTFLAICFCLIVSELYFRIFFAESDGLTITLACQNWFKKYWKPINSFGYRDNEYTKSNLKDKTIILVVGDSFAAGQGIEKISERFSGILAKKLGQKFAVITIAQAGWDIQDEIKALKSFPYKPNIVIWSYFSNDILDAADKRGKGFSFSSILPTKGLAWLASSSYFINFLYWCFARIKISSFSKEYIKWFMEQYKDPVIWSTHKQELESVYKLCRDLNAELLIVVFPFLQDVKASQFISKKIKSVFNNFNVPVLDVSKLTYQLNKKDLIVNSIDAHPGIKLHKLVGDNLYSLVVKSHHMHKAYTNKIVITNE